MYYNVNIYTLYKCIYSIYTIYTYSILHVLISLCFNLSVLLMKPACLLNHF